MKLKIETQALRELQLWLISREEDIAIGEEDFAELRYVFEVIVGRKAKVKNRVDNVEKN